MYQTTNLIWSAASTDTTVHDLTLVLNPSLQKLSFSGALGLDSFELITKEDAARYTIQQYAVEQHNTIMGTPISVSPSSISSQPPDNHTTTINYRIPSNIVKSTKTLSMHNNTAISPHTHSPSPLKTTMTT